MSSLGTVLLDQRPNFLSRLSANAKPVVDPVAFEDSSRVGFGNHWIVRSKFFDHTSVTRSPRVHRTDTEKRSMGAPHLF